MTTQPSASGAADVAEIARPRGGFGSKATSIVIAGILAAVLLFFSLRGIEWHEVGRIVATAQPRGLALAAAIGSGTLFLRSIRWRVLLTAAGDVRLWTVFCATAAGYFGNNFLPARAGEVVRAVMVKSRSALEIAFVLTTAVCERVVDAVALMVVMAVALIALPTRPGWTTAVTTPFAILAAAAVLLIAFAPRLEPTVRTILVEAPLLRRLRPPLLLVMESVLRGIRSFHDARRLALYVGLTIVIWCMDALATVVGGAALGFAIPLPVAFLLIAALGLGSALPSTPGYVGIYQFVAVTALTPFGFSRTDAIAYILVAQAVMYAVTALWGTIGLLGHRYSKLDASRQVVG